MKVALATPAVARDWMVRRADLGVAHHVESGGEAVHALLEQRLDCLRRHVAAGEAGAAGRDDDVDRLGRRSRLRICARIFSTSSVTMARAATAWPAFSIRSASVAPDLSSAISRVSDTVSTAILSGTKGRLSSIPGMVVT